MNVDWQQLLAGSNMTFVNGRLHIPYAAASSLTRASDDGVIVPLPQTGVIRVAGADATAFLHTQLSQDIQGLGDSDWVFAGYCNPKGRLLGLFRVLLSDDGILLLTNRVLVEPLLKRLRMFVMRSKVTLEDVSGKTAAVGLAGPAALAALEQLTGSIPEAAGHVHRAGDLLALTLGGKPERFLLLATGAEVPSLWETLSARATLTADEFWTLLDIRAGWPEIHPQTVEAFVPQQVNLELINGVNFRKGCYPGQEIVARMHYLGKPSRRMLRFTGPGYQGDPGSPDYPGPAPAPGSKLTLADGTSAGDVVQAAAGPQGLELLAVVHNKHRDRQDLGVDGIKVVQADLPYAV